MSYRHFVAVLAALLAGALSAFAQNTVTTDAVYPDGRSIDVSSGFDVTVVRGDVCNVRITVDEELLQYVESYVRGGKVYVRLDEKSFSPYLKRRFRGRNAEVPVLRADITVKHLDTLFLHDNVVLDNVSPLFSDDSVTVVMDGSSMISNLDFRGRKFVLDMTRSSSANVKAEAESISARLYGASSLTMEYSADELALDSGGGSVIKADGSSAVCRIYSESTSETTLTGSARELDITAKGTSRIIADSLSVSSASARISGPARCTVNASDKLKADLSGGAHLMFKGNPPIEIERIVSSSMTRNE